METNRCQNKVLTIPNLLSFFRIGLIPVIVWLYFTSRYALVGWTLILSGVTDVVDGIVARKFHMVSDFGKILDPVADKLTQAAVLLCLMVRYPLMVLPIVLMAAKELYMGITVARIARKLGKVYSADWHGKLATFVLYATMFLHVLWESIPELLSNVLILSCAALIALSFLLYGIKCEKALRT